MSEVTESVIVLSFDSIPSQPSNLYPSLGVAVSSNSVPSSNSPPSVDTVPPSPVVTVSV